MPTKKTAAQLGREIRYALDPHLTPFELALLTNAYADLRQKLGAQRGEDAVQVAERSGVRF